MKKIIAFLLAIMLLMGVVACQPTPDKPFVESKNDGELEEAIYGDAAPEYVNGYEAPETWQETLESDDGITVINIDAKLNIPNVAMYPVYRVAARDITVDDAKAFIQAFAGDETLYTIDKTRIKSVIEKEIEKKIEQIAEYDDPNSDPGQKLASGAYTQDEFDYWLNKNKEDLSALQEEYKTAPVDYALNEMPYEFHSIQGGRSMNGVIMRDGGFANYFQIQTDYQAPFGRTQIKNYVSKYDISGYNPQSKLYPIDSMMWKDNAEELGGYEEAKSVADDIIYNKLGYSDYTLNRACTQENRDTSNVDWDHYDPNAVISNSTFVFLYTKTVDNIPTLFYLPDTNESNVDYYSKPAQHCVAVYVNSKDDYEVIEQSTMEFKEKLTPNTKLLSFDEIQDIFRRYIFIAADTSDLYLKNDLKNNKLERVTYNITDIRLGYIRILEKNNIDNGLLVPVWNFYGTQMNKYKDNNGQGYVLNENNEALIDWDAGNAFLCINAIDGSIIDLDQGY